VPSVVTSLTLLAGRHEQHPVGVAVAYVRAAHTG